VAKASAVCAYCGRYGDTEEEHVVPQCFAPPEVQSSCRWVCVRACSRCNRQFSADESEFREFCVLAGSTEHNPVRDLLFHGPLKRNWERLDGKGKGALLRTLQKIQTPDGISAANRQELIAVPNELRIVPNERMFRVVRKIIRGLYFSHFSAIRSLPQVLPEAQIRVWPIFDVMLGVLDEFTDWHVIHDNVFCMYFLRSMNLA
jgi:hypothetical protein